MSFLLVNLAIADIIYAVFITPRVFYQLPFARHPDGVFGTVLCKFVTGGSVAWTGSACSIATFVAIAIERYYAVMYPHKWNLTKRKLQVIWVTPFFGYLITFFYYRYLTDWRDVHRWSERQCYLSSLNSRHPTIYIGYQDSSAILQSATQSNFFWLRNDYLF